MKPFWLISVLLVVFSNSKATTYPYDWEAGRKQYALSAEEKSQAEIIIKAHVEYTYAMEKDELVMYSVFHKIVRVNNSEAIQRNNRITISMDNTIELVELKARTISGNGKAITFEIGRASCRERV